MKLNKRIVVFEDESCIYNLPETPRDFLSWWSEKFDLVPDEYKDSARVQCDTSSYYDSIQFGVTISYTRPETDEEENTRIKEEDAKRKFIENQELCQLEKLKAKYGI